MYLAQYQIRWLPALLNPVVQSLFSGVRSIVDQELLFYRKGKAIFEPTTADNTLALLAFFIGALVKNSNGLERRFAEHEMGHLFFNGAVLAFSSYEEKEYPVAIQLWLNKFFLVEKDFVPVIQIDEEEGEGFLVNIAVQKQSDRLSASIPLAKVLAQKQYQGLRMEVLRDLAMLADYFPQINRLVANHGKEALFFDAEAFVNVLFKVLPTIRLFGIKVLLPKALRKLFRPQMSMLVTSEEESGVVSKSTLLNILGLLDDQDEGSFLFNGIEVAKFNERKRADLRKRNIGFVFQSFNQRKNQWLTNLQGEITFSSLL